MKRKITLLLQLGVCVVTAGVGLRSIFQSRAESDAIFLTQVSQIPVNSLDAHVTPRMRAEFVNQLMRGVSTSDLKTLENCVCWDEVDPSMREHMSATLQDMLNGSQDFPLDISFVKRTDAGQMIRVVNGHAQSLNLPWVTNIGFHLDGRLAPASAGHTRSVGVKDGRLYIIGLRPNPPA